MVESKALVELLVAYESALLDYCQTRSEEALYLASEVSGRLMSEQRYGPDEIVALHYDALQSVTAGEQFTASDRLRMLNDAHQFLLEVMIGYGARYKEFLDLRLEAAERRAETAEQSEREKLDVLAAVAHELGNPLTVVAGSLQMASRLLDAGDLTDLRALIGESRDAVERLTALTRQIVAASRDETPELVFEPCDLVEIVRRSAQWAQAEATNSGITFAETYPAEPVLVLGSSDELPSVFSDLLSNALRYTEPGGTITLAVWPEDDVVRVRVSDSGIGIGEADRERIFEKFYRASNARRAIPNGLGMGLFIVWSLTELHGGTVDVESAEGKGSSFTVTLPRLDGGGGGGRGEHE